MRAHPIAVLIAFVAGGIDAQACSPAAPLPSPEELVQMAEVIVRAEAVSIERRRARFSEPYQGYGPVTFQITEVLKGAPQSSTVTFVGYFEETDDRNDRAVPYDFVRRGGRRGNCYALNYRQGAEYLLLLKAADYSVHPPTSDQTPYWSPLTPTNEQLFGGQDPWLVWVVSQLYD
jgi:hypothetical protein